MSQPAFYKIKYKDDSANLEMVLYALRSPVLLKYIS